MTDNQQPAPASQSGRKSLQDVAEAIARIPAPLGCIAWLMDAKTQIDVYTRAEAQPQAVVAGYGWNNRSPAVQSAIDWLLVRAAETNNHSHENVLLSYLRQLETRPAPAVSPTAESAAPVCDCMGSPSCGDGAFEALMRRTCPVHGDAAKPTQPDVAAQQPQQQDGVRDSFAMAALPSVYQDAVNALIGKQYDPRKHSGSIYKAIAVDCYSLADAMLAERNKQVASHTAALVEAAENVVIAFGMGWDMEGTVDVLEKSLAAAKGKGV